MTENDIIIISWIHTYFASIFYAYKLLIVLFKEAFPYKSNRFPYLFSIKSMYQIIIFVGNRVISTLLQVNIVLSQLKIHQLHPYFILG